MTRKRPEIQPCGERHERYLSCATCHPIPPENPDRLQGPEVGALCYYQDDRYQPEPTLVRVLERSYVWGPNDPSYHGGSRRYDEKVVQFLDRPARTLVIADAKLTPAPVPA
jgi:hypothetical protein